MAILFFSAYLHAQEIPLGTWRQHISTQAIYSVVVTPQNTVYAAAQNGLVVVEPADNSVTVVGSVQGLNTGVLTSVAYDELHEQLLIAYTDGAIDLLMNNSITHYTGLKNSPLIPGSKQINHISVHGAYAYLSADFGMVVFDLNSLEVKETWRNIGAGGTPLIIFESTFKNDSIFLATQNGVLAGDLSDNLLDFNNWKRYDQGSFNRAVESVSFFNGKVYAALDGDGIYYWSGINWTKNSFLQALDYNQLSSASVLYVASTNGLWQVDNLETATPINTELLVDPLTVAEHTDGKRWVGDLRQGLVSDVSGSWQVFTSSSGPSFNGCFRLSLQPNGVYALAGGFTESITPAGNQEYINAFQSGQWSAMTMLFDKDVTGIVTAGSKTYVSSFTEGVQVTEGTVITVFDQNNSPLTDSRVSAMALGSQGVWVANYSALQPLHLLKSDNTWQSFSFPFSQARYPVDLRVDFVGQVWMQLAPTVGGVVVFNPQTNQSVYLTDTPGQGGLPAQAVYSLAVDKAGRVWVGTDGGVGYFSSPVQVFNGNVNAVIPLVNGRFLLRDETTRAIAADGADRKWLGTENGVWLFDEFGEQEVLYFEAASGGLLSDDVNSIVVHPQNGEVFFGTGLGISSYRGDATEAIPPYAVKVFPNPVTASFTGWVSINGLPENALVKITDVAGTLMWQSQANGGTLAWNVRDPRGNRVATGMYLVLAVSADGSETLIGKIAVVD
jgi:ligand-binding sensor domain-containing protein